MAWARAQTASGLDRVAGQSWLSLLSKSFLPLIKTKAGWWKHPKEALLTSPRKAWTRIGEGLRISEWGCVLESGPTGLLMDCPCGKVEKALSHVNSQVAPCSTWVHGEEASPFHSGMGEERPGENLTSLLQKPPRNRGWTSLPIQGNWSVAGAVGEGQQWSWKRGQDQLPPT